MNPEQQRAFVAAVDEMRRLQIVTPKPPNALARKNLTAAESKVDGLLALYREQDPNWGAGDQRPPDEATEAP